MRAGLTSPISQNGHKNKGSVNPEPEVNVFSAIPPQNPPPPFVFGDCNNSGADDVPVLFNFRSSGGDDKGSSDPETHRGSHQDSLNNPNDLVLSSSEDDTEQTDDKAHQDGAMSDPSFNASSDCSGAEGDPPDSGQSPPSHPLVYALPKISESSSIAGPTGKKGKSKKTAEQETTSKKNNTNRLFGFDKVICNVNNHIWIFSDVGVDIRVLFDSDQLLHTKVCCNNLPDSFLLSVVYGKNNKIERRTLWEDLVSVSQNVTPWMVGGDFNIVLYPHEKKGDTPPILSEMEEFRDSILECNLMDGGYVGSPFTWESFWEQKARVKWTMEGERNTKFFHDLVKKKRHKNLIHCIHDNGNILTDPIDIQESAVSYFSGLFGNDPTSIDQFNNELYRDTLSDDDNIFLCSLPTLDEVKNIVFGMATDSVAGPDGFNDKFYQACWDIIKVDVLDAVLDFFNEGNLSQAYCSTSLTLIPKNPSPNNWKDFRPII
ncbi:hypothetical protein OROMI_007818 [Orobanche minor]